MVTSDIGLCAALATHHVNPTAISSKAGRMAWVYDDSPAVRDLRDAYFTGRLQRSLITYNTTLRMFQAQLKGGR